MKYVNVILAEKGSFSYTQQALNNKIQADSCQAQGPAADKGRVSNDFACLCIMGFRKTHFAIGSSLTSFLLLQSIFWASGLQIATESGIKGVADPLTALLSGSFLFAAFFMITDPVSSSQTTDAGRWIYGAVFGILTVLIRIFANWVEGVTFAILLANMFAPLLDTLLKGAKAKKKLKKAEGGKA
jgi:Na+-translocating ferredoxin:NAD+ oxidoreductase RnfD subunit